MVTNLKSLCELYLSTDGTKSAQLCKFEQISNWETRPLRQSQMHYAALDAHVLIQIYSWLQVEVTKHSYNVQDNMETLEKKQEVQAEESKTNE